MKGCVLKAIGAISKVTNALLELKNSKKLTITTQSKNLSTMAPNCTDPPDSLLNQGNTDLEQKIGMVMLHTVETINTVH